MNLVSIKTDLSLSLSERQTYQKRSVPFAQYLIGKIFNKTNTHDKNHRCNFGTSLAETLPPPPRVHAEVQLCNWGNFLYPKILKMNVLQKIGKVFERNRQKRITEMIFKPGPVFHSAPASQASPLPLLSRWQSCTSRTCWTAGGPTLRSKAVAFWTCNECDVYYEVISWLVPQFSCYSRSFLPIEFETS